MKISCVIPAYNDPFLLMRCLSSIITQTKPAFEVIISDDSSNADVEQVLAPFLKAYSNCRYIKGPQTGNPVDNWNHGIDKCRGDYITLVHHDDWFARKDYLQLLSDVLARGPTGRCAFAHATLVGGLRQTRVGFARLLGHSLGDPHWTLFALNWIGPPSAFIFPRETEERYDPNLRSLVDVDFYYRVAKQQPLLSVDTLSILSGAHADQITAGLDIKRVALDELKGIMNKNIGLTAAQGQILKLILKLRILIDFREITPKK
jgi:glycosyltransferase involved in cell wall biosynthesis